MALQQAMRARRRSADLLRMEASPLLHDLALLVEASAADRALADLLPGLAKPVNESRHASLVARPLLSAFPKHAQPLETFLRIILRSDCRAALDPLLRSGSPAESLRVARRIASELLPPATRAPGQGESPHERRVDRRTLRAGGDAADDEDGMDDEAGPWMVQADEPHEKAEDPLGLQRPADRSDERGADELAEMLAELPEARQIATPQRPRDVLLSDDVPQRTSRLVRAAFGDEDRRLSYPEWDYREQAYRDPGAIVRPVVAAPGAQSWVDATMERHRAMLDLIRRRFEMLRARQLMQRRQAERHR